ncbi:phosphoenolpyruvate synthase [Candidatus Gottesmanbacteria bacterium]|nr:phosphoenolpyruvate synthase [Candidatus Gottesmanbacteria bacterium]
MNKKLVVWFDEVDKDDIGLVGGKGANLGEMTQAGFPVPPGFIITSEAYYHFLDDNKLRPKIKDYIQNLNHNDQRSLTSVSRQIKSLILRSPIPKEVALQIVSYYHQLPTYIHAKKQKQDMVSHLLKHVNPSFVAVRSSATAEDLPGASFAGQQETYLNVVGDTNVLNKVRACWASLFEPRAIFYRSEQKFDHFKVGIAVPVQKMINSETSGVMFTVDPSTGDKKKIVIEAIFGLGEFIVQGIETPDQYIVDKYALEIVEKHIATQEKALVREGNNNVIKKLSSRIQSAQKISTSQVMELATLGKKLERHYFFPQDIEWAIEKGHVYIVQTRPITTIGKRGKPQVAKLETNQKPILLGTAASPGIVTGPVTILKSAKEIHKLNTGDILVAKETNPDYVPAMRKAAAVVTERGGRTSHAAIVSRELGIPAVVGVSDILKTLKTGQVITVDGQTGNIYKGSLISPQVKGFKTINISVDVPKTATKVYVNLAEPQIADQTSKLPVDGVGLLRAEFMIADIGIHPKKLIADKRQSVFIDKLAGGLTKFCQAFSPRPVVYRTTDFKTNEYRNLIGGKAYEPEEPNPMLGFRGANRYIASSDVFELELRAIKQVRNKGGFKNLWVMIPFVRTIDELFKVKRIMAAEGLIRTPSFKLWMMVEIPSNVILLDKFIDVGIDGVSVGSNDLTMLILGTDRDNSEVAGVFDEKNEAVLWALEKVIKTCHKRKITSSICGQAASDYPDLVEKLVSWGVTSVSVNPDAVVNTRQIVHQAEKKVGK